MMEAIGPYIVVFEPLGETETPYLRLLGLRPDAQAAAVVEAIRVARTADLAGVHLLSLLRDPNWRAHLVGGIATYLRPNQAAIAQLWIAADAGSWVSPQLCALLSLIDSSFLEHGVDRLTRGAQVVGEVDFLVASSLEQHSNRGPAGPRARSAKMAAALLALLVTDHPTDPGVQRCARDAGLLDLITSDVDDGGRRALHWRESLMRLLS